MSIGAFVIGALYIALGIDRIRYSGEEFSFKRWWSNPDKHIVRCSGSEHIRDGILSIVAGIVLLWMIFH